MSISPKAEPKEQPPSEAKGAIGGFCKLPIAFIKEKLIGLGLEVARVGYSCVEIAVVVYIAPACAHRAALALHQRPLGDFDKLAAALIAKKIVGLVALIGHKKIGVAVVVVVDPVDAAGKISFIKPAPSVMRVKPLALVVIEHVSPVCRRYW